MLRDRFGDIDGLALDKRQLAIVYRRANGASNSGEWHGICSVIMIQDHCTKWRIRCPVSKNVKQRKKKQKELEKQADGILQIQAGPQDQFYPHS